MAEPQPRQRKPLLDRLGRLLERVLDRALALDPPLRAELAPLEGRRIGVELRGTGLALALTVHGGRFTVGPHWDRAADLNVRATPGSLLAFGVGAAIATPFPPGRVDIAGDAELARRFERVLRRYRPDVEEAFARVFGDVIGVPLARGLYSSWNWTRESVQALVRDGADFLRDESRDLVAPAEADAFADDVDRLRERADRLAARIARLATGRAR